MRRLRILPFIAGLLLGTCANAQELSIKGTVSDAGNGEPIIGAVVKVKDMPGGVVTDLDGKFTLKVEHQPPFTLSVVYFGYAPKAVAV
ncbi:MAG TPA: carboxypeptidase-like regulatory domain-containing protein, partial [Flavobacteriales bacterium]|nr:carboxypeptidase-like regulatory domain-containing protein [Flavobacteriales bacterium]